MSIRILVWDWPVRIGHWAMAIAFSVAYISAESERWRMVHVISGCTVLAIVLFRLIWGMVGSYHARFTNFLRHPRRVYSYLLSLTTQNKQHYTGHNPAGAWSVLALLCCLLVICSSGLWIYTQTSSPSALAQWHEWSANAAIWLVGFHLLGVVASSVLGHENLVASMLHGQKNGAAREAIPRAYGAAAVGLIAWILCFVYFWI